MAARQQALIQSERKSLGKLEKPVAGNRGYVCDLELVRISEMVDPTGNGKKLNMVMWDNTCSNVAATCWDATKCNEIRMMVMASGTSEYFRVPFL
jgi:hypothetical protein